MNFRKSSKGGGGHFQSKNLCCKIWTFKQGYLTMKLIQRGLFRLCLKNLQQNFPKMRGEGSKAVWNFSENSSVLEVRGIPKRSRCKLHGIAWNIYNAILKSHYAAHAIYVGWYVLQCSLQFANLVCGAHCIVPALIFAATFAALHCTMAKLLHEWESNHKVVNFGNWFLCQFSPKTYKFLHGA